MCIIIDSNLVGDCIKNKEAMEPVNEFISKGGSVISSIDLLNETSGKEEKSNRLFAELRRTGQLKIIKDVPDLPNDILHIIKSNDAHVISLAKVSKVAVVCTKDDNLIEDLKNPDIIKKPRCKVYKHPGASDILRGCCP